MSKIASTFKSDAEGWTIDGDAASYGWKDHRGNPGGYFTWTDSVTSGADAYYVAPEKFLGDQRHYYGGVLSYDIRDIRSDPDGAPDVELISSSGKKLVAILGEPGTSWTHFSIDLSEGAGWHLNTVDGREATKHDLRQVLGNLSQVLIRAEYVDGDEVGGLDNVIFFKQGSPAVHAIDDEILAQTLVSHYSNPISHALFEPTHLELF